MIKTPLLVIALMLGAVGAVTAQTPAPQAPKPLEVGVVAPDFELAGATRYGVLSQPVKLSDFKGKTVVLAFFPRARTRGCTIQMHTYRDQYAKLLNAGQNAILIAISNDPADALAAWARDDQFQFLMASDRDLKTATAYGAVARAGGNANRNLFIVGPDGKIAWRATPFLETDPGAYTVLGEQIRKLLPSADGNGK